MKTKLLLSFLSLCLIGHSQSSVVLAPQNNFFVGSTWAPNGSTDQTTLRIHYIIPASELTGIPTGTSIDEIGFAIQAANPGTASGNLELYIENTSDVTNVKSANWANAISTMTSVYNATYNIPSAPGPVDFSLTTPFTYNGGGLYVAYEYIGATFGLTLGSTAPLYWVNTLLAAGCRYDATNISTPSDSVNTVSTVRPETRFTFVNPFANNLRVSDLSPDFGTVNSFMYDDNSVDVEISNIGTQTQTNVPITLELVGGSTYTSTQTLASIASGASEVVTFNSVPTDGGAGQIIKVHFPADQQSFNDTLEYSQSVTCDELGYMNTGPLNFVIGVGANGNPAIYSVRYDINNILPVNISDIKFRVSTTTAAVGNVVKGILLNSSGVIIDSTSAYSILGSDLGGDVKLSFLNGNVDYSNQTVFAGVRLTTQGVNALGIQSQLNPPLDRNVIFGANGGNITYQNGFDPLMISIGIEPRPSFLISNTTTGAICAGSSAVLVTFPTIFDDYVLTANSASLQNNTTGLFNVTPATTTTYQVDLELNGCFTTTIPATITTVSEYTSTLFEDICSNDSYNFNGQSLNTAGQYIDTLIAAGGCDSIITLNLDVSQATTSTLDEAICAGDAYDLNGQLISTSGTYTETIQNSVGCDSTITLNLTVLLEDMSVSQVGATLTVAAGAAGTTYQWIDCDNGNSPIPGATSQSFTPTDDMGIVGNYAVIVNSGNCSETSACTTIDFTSVSENEGFELTLFPNPVVDFIGIQTNMSDIRSYSVFDATGKLVLNGNFNNESQLLINTGTLATGTYFLTLFAGDKSVNKVFVK